MSSFYSDADFKIAAALDDHSCVLYTVGENFQKFVTLNHNQTPIVGIKFSNNSRNIIYTASNNNITACDLRAKGKVVAEFKGIITKLGFF